MTDNELVKFQYQHVKQDHHDPDCRTCALLEAMMRLRLENEQLRELVDKMTAGLRHRES